jgi:hypothetical protein
MKINEIFSLVPKDSDDNDTGDHRRSKGDDLTWGHEKADRTSRRDDVQWHQELAKEDLYDLVTGEGKKVNKTGLTHAKAEELRKRPSVIEKFGYLSIEKQ